MDFQIHKAERRRAKLRCGLVGPAGSGKTKSALFIAKGLGGKVVVIDTENGSADLYSNVTAYDVLPITAPFEAEKYIEAIKYCEEKYDIIIIDSLSHAWAGVGGILDEQAKRADGKNSYTAWRDVTPKHNALIEAMLQSKAHIIATMRAKTEYVLQEDSRGKMVPRKVGMAPVQREGMDYEFTIVFDINRDHNAEVSKDRTDLFGDKIFQITDETGLILKDWSEGDPTVEYATTKQLTKLNTVGTIVYADKWEFVKEQMKAKYNVSSTKDISKNDMKTIIDNLEKIQNDKQ